MTINGTTGVNNAFTVSQKNADDTAFTLAGVDTTLSINTGGGPLLLDPGAGIVNSVTYVGTAGPDSITINPTVGTVALPGYQTLSLTEGDVSSLQFDAMAVGDIFTVLGTGGPNLTFNGDQGLLDFLNQTAGTTTITEGGTANSGTVQTQDVNATFTGITEVAVNGTGAVNDVLDVQSGGLMRLFNNGANWIDVNSSDTVNFTDFPTVGLVGSGATTFNVSPAGLTTVTAIDVNGDSSGTDSLVVNGTTGTDAIGYNPTGIGAGNVTISGQPTLDFTGIAQVGINGQGGGDTLTLTAPFTLGVQTGIVTLTPAPPSIREPPCSGRRATIPRRTRP